MILVGWLLVYGGQNVVAQKTFPFLQSTTQTYSNVVVTGKTVTDVFIRHSKGIATVKARDLDGPTRKRLGFPEKEPVQAAATPLAPAKVEAAKPTPKPWYGSMERVKWITVAAGAVLLVLPIFFFKGRSESSDNIAAEELGPLILNLDSFLASNPPLKSLKDIFPAPTVSHLVEYGQARERQYARTLHPDCEVCLRARASQVQVYEWVANWDPSMSFTKTNFLLLFLGIWSVTVKKTVVSFGTTHALCKSCARKTRLRRILSIFLQGSGFFSLLAGLFMLAVSGMILIDLSNHQPVDNESWWCLAGGLAALAYCWFGYKYANKFLMPETFRSIGLYPFGLARVVVPKNCRNIIPMPEQNDSDSAVNS
jgi:hypothetical protein